jgi:hypothetical protein
MGECLKYEGPPDQRRGRAYALSMVLLQALVRVGAALS